MPTQQREIPKNNYTDKRVCFEGYNIDEKKKQEAKLLQHHNFMNCDLVRLHLFATGSILIREI